MKIVCAPIRCHEGSNMATSAAIPLVGEDGGDGSGQR